MRLERRPLERQFAVSVARYHRSVPSGFDRQVEVRPPADVDDFLADLGVFPPAVVPVLVRVRGIEMLDEKVGDVGTGVGHAPGNSLVMPDHHERQAGKSGAGNVESRRDQVRHVPNARYGMAEMRVVGEERFARASVRAAYYPVVAAEARSSRDPAHRGIEKSLRFAFQKADVKEGRSKTLSGTLSAAEGS